MLSVHEVPDTNIIEIIVEGSIDPAMFDATILHLESVIAEHKTVRILEVIETLENFPLSRIWDDVRFGLSNMGHVSHVAVVAHARWIEILTKIFGPLTKATVRYFDKSEIEEARQWLRTAE